MLSVVLWAQVHLVDQHTEKEFHALQDAFKVASISGDTSHKAFFAYLVKENDVIICTAQILQNALVSTEEDMHVELTGGHQTAHAAGPTALAEPPAEPPSHPALLPVPEQISRCW